MELAHDDSLSDDLRDVLRFADTVSQAHFRLSEIVGALHGDRQMKLVHERGLRYDELSVADVMSGLSLLDAIDFDAMRTAGDFLEWAQVHGNCYGTSRHWLDEQLSAGRDVLLEIDWQGAQQVRTLFPDAVGIFILPPSLDALSARLNGRGQDAADVIERRLAAARDEIRHLHEFDFVIINDILSQAQAELVTVVQAARLLTTSQMARHPETFKSLGID